MPRLRRMRLCGIGHESARFDDVTLDFTDRHGRPTNSVLWLRNGGGKTSLLSLFFAGVRPNKREFLGQRADERVRRLEDYVGPRDHGVVVCEWELDVERGLFGDAAPCYLSGVFYQRKEGDSDNGGTDVDRLFFATLVSSSEVELTLEGLPIYGDQGSGRTRRSFNSFRRRLRQLDHEHPDHSVFVEDKNQAKFEDELASRGIDPQVFFYQIQMNEREGGVTQLFSFASDEEFTDFLLRMTFDQQHARQVREQLSTFRQEIIERNEQLKPELEFCQGLITRLHKLAGIARERTDVFRQSALAQRALDDLGNWAASRDADLQASVTVDRAQQEKSEQAANVEHEAASVAERWAAVHQRDAFRLRLQEVQAEYEASERARAKAKRQKELWQAAVPLARVWDARREAVRYREMLQRKLTEFAPELEKLIESATTFANALDGHAKVLRENERGLSQEVDKYRAAADQTRNEASAAGEKAAQDEKQIEYLEGRLLQATQEEQLLRDQGVLTPEDKSVSDGMNRIALAIAATACDVSASEHALADADRERAEVVASCTQAELDRGVIEKERQLEKHCWDTAVACRKSLEADATLLRLLQTEQVDVEAAATSAAAQASDELRRVTDALLRIAVEAAEDERAIHGLTETELLPPTQDVDSLLHWLRTRNLTCWSGWEYLHRNVTLAERRTVISQLPQLVAGIVVANGDYGRAAEMLRSACAEQPSYQSRSPLVIAPASAFQDVQHMPWVVVGPTSDAHFDKGAGALELTRLLAEKSQRQNEVEGYHQWRDALSELRHRLHSFQNDHPRGWFASQRQKLELVAARLEEIDQQLQRLSSKRKTLDGKIEQVRQRLRSLSEFNSRIVRDRDRLELFERSLGRQREGWQTDLAFSRTQAQEARQLQAQLREKVGVWQQKERDAQGQIRAIAVQAAQMESELSKVKYCDSTRRESIAGPAEALRAQYELLLDDYEGKVNADAMSKLAEAKDQEAERDEREFQRVLAKLSQFTADEVIAELNELPEGVTAQQHLEQADAAFDESTRRLGPLAIRRNSVKVEFEAVESVCVELSREASLPILDESCTADEHLARSVKLDQECNEHRELATALRVEVDEITKRLMRTSHEIDKLQKDQQRLASIRLNHQRQFERLAAAAQDSPPPIASAPAPIKDEVTLVANIDEVERTLNHIREQQELLDVRRDASAKDVGDWSRQERFGKLKSSVSHRFRDRAPAVLEAKAEFDIQQLNDCIFQIQEKLKEADKQREIVIHVLATAVDEALGLLGRVSRMSKLPESLPQAGKQFLKIETKASENPTERRTYIGELIDELLERGDVGDGLQLVQKAVRRVARRISVRVLHPDLHKQADRVSIAQMRGFSGGERLTCAILLYCALIRHRHGESNRRLGSSVLILDNPIGTASRLSFLDMQREVARAMNVQLIYATAVKDLDAVGALENVIRLRNSRADRRTGRRFIEADANGENIGAAIDNARVVFDTAPSSLVRSNGNGSHDHPEAANSEVQDDARHT